MTARSTVLFGSLFFIALAGCQKPEPPRITPKEARVVAVSPQGLELRLLAEATNPNRIAVSVQSVTARAKLDGRYDLGPLTIAKPVVLPPSAPTMIDVPMSMPWTSIDLNALATLAASPNPIPYTVEGVAKVGGERLNVDVPFTLSGTITAEQMAGAALKGLSIPGLKLR